MQNNVKIVSIESKSLKIYFNVFNKYRKLQ